MKQPFINATVSSHRKGKETLANHPQPHPLRPTAVSSPDAPHTFHHLLPVRVTPKVAKVEEPLNDLEKMKRDLLQAMRDADKKKPKAVPKSKLIGMASATATEDPTRDYADVLAMLLAKK